MNLYHHIILYYYYVLFWTGDYHLPLSRPCVLFGTQIEPNKLYNNSVACAGFWYVCSCRGGVRDVSSNDLCNIINLFNIQYNDIFIIQNLTSIVQLYFLCYTFSNVKCRKTFKVQSCLRFIKNDHIGKGDISHWTSSVHATEPANFYFCISHCVVYNIM